jgi:2-hydroxychromene-2-carboxylate isomerase
MSLSAERDENLAQYAAALGLDEVRLIREVLAGAYFARAREDFKSGVRGGVNGTPSFFINGEPI